ncbi:LOW QUALITY PROTEIN: hypothetical protein T265_15728 [Opisthorchis viverrini]|uniref:Uncharacterized protein n=1 Tax=Opisthorchis viverrini TaxID=6198 RepID=A0A074Z0G1_OPIVI|nr:LOW QUALITY PROTEIN: hypothetical protein T265_15728 [Opisthorchis viverrini]KER18962.1 LOW QUALITY PROTEIN: hypothetical protein T265_15728 [Opisthorchis viverrini]
MPSFSGNVDCASSKNSRHSQVRLSCVLSNYCADSLKISVVDQEKSVCCSEDVVHAFISFLEPNRQGTVMLVCNYRVRCISFDHFEELNRWVRILNTHLTCSYFHADLIMASKESKLSSHAKRRRRHQLSIWSSKRSQHSAAVGTNSAGVFRSFINASDDGYLHVTRDRIYFTTGPGCAHPRLLATWSFDNDELVQCGTARIKTNEDTEQLDVDRASLFFLTASPYHPEAPGCHLFLSDRATELCEWIENNNQSAIYQAEWRRLTSIAAVLDTPFSSGPGPLGLMSTSDQTLSDHSHTTPFNVVHTTQLGTSRASTQCCQCSLANEYCSLERIQREEADDTVSPSASLFVLGILSQHIPFQAWPSCGVTSQVALLFACSRVGKRKHDIANAHLTLPRSPSSTLPYPNLNTLRSTKTDHFAHRASHTAAVSVRLSSVTTINTSKSVFIPLEPVYLTAVNVRTLKQAGQKAALARTLDSICIDVCCLLETRLQDASTVFEPTSPYLCCRFRLRTSSDAEASAAGYAGVGVVLSDRVEASMLDWISVDMRSIAPFIVFAYAPTDCSSASAEDSFHDTLGVLLHRAKSSDIVVVAGDIEVQVEKLSTDRARLGVRLRLDTRRMDDEDRLLQMCTGHILFLCSTNFRNSGNRLTTWCPPTNQSRTQIDPTAVSCR